VTVNELDREGCSGPDASPRYDAELHAAITAARAAAELARENFHRGEAHRTDEQADREIEILLLKAFPNYGYRGEEVGLTAYPRDQKEHLWLVDPQDGTTAAARGFRGSAVSIALLRDGLPVLGVVLAYAAPDSSGDLFYWAEGMKALHRNNDSVLRTWQFSPTTQSIAFISQDADQAPEANAKILYPMRYRSIPGIAYRLALVAIGEGDLAISLNGPTGWDVAGGHALLIGAGGDLFDATGKQVTYDKTGSPLNRELGRCFGGHADFVSRYTDRSWNDIRSKKSSETPASSSLSFLIPGRVVTDPRLLSRAQGCLLGQCAGDALGSLVEFQSAADITRAYPNGPSFMADGGTFDTIAGQPTDDSELALALARSIVAKGKYDREDVASAYAKWRDSHPFDIGNATSMALSPALAALKSKGQVAKAAAASASRNTQANGALMRISPLAIFGCEGTAEALMALAREDAKLTHPHAICQDANAIFAAAIAFALKSGEDAQKVYQFAINLACAPDIANPVRERLLAARDHSPAEFDNFSNIGWVLVAFQNAFFQLLHAPSVDKAVISTVRFGGDTDTNAAITGALLGAVHGRDGLPKQWTNQIQSCRPIAGLAGVNKPRPAVYWPVDALSLAENLLLAGRAPRQILANEDTV
jgi:ADP-ribosyl-[dinitrogen reductase] hydrolase